jgi:AraC-like DNA-binding protein
MDPRIQRVITFIEENPGGPLSLATLARVAGLSSSRLRHKFKAETGITPTAYLQTHRLSVAKELLVSQQLTVKEAKAAVGIESDSYFTHQFKHVFGITPSSLKLAKWNSTAPVSECGTLAR